ncbi:MAG: hypothetical protein B6242_12540 [Anaerolineaceae bacterium 4572_78]|nr:MAG: hypothetical protein B6242_12540 [Anaerolineaceae bacterium 4572_78]
MTAGTYTIFETDKNILRQEQWALLNVTCRDKDQNITYIELNQNDFTANVTLKSGQNLVCTFKNELYSLGVANYQIFLPIVSR